VVKKLLQSLARRITSWVQEPPPDPHWLLESDHLGDRISYHLWSLRKLQPNLRAHFAWGVLSAAHLAAGLEIPRISVIEFGVAGGNGLVALERIARDVERIHGVGIDVYGFDTGAGLPKPQDYRDLPNLYRESGFAMDEAKLRARLTRAHLILGDVEQTVASFVASQPAPVGFISIDVDLYSSTMNALKLFDADTCRLLPRVYCYFDDILGYTFSEFTGERLAIADFNAAHPTTKVSPIFGLRYFLREPDRTEAWPDQMFIVHRFDHHLYGRYTGDSNDRGGWTELQPPA
jgi:hypothetical protein